MSTELKFPKKGAVARLREFYLEITKKPLTSEQRKNLEDTFKKRNESPDVTENNTPKKIAKSDQDIELS